MKQRSLALLCAFVAFCAPAAFTGSDAQAAADIPTDIAQIDLLPGWQMENGHRMAAIRIALAPGWHTYWRAPGASGIPPSFDFDGSQNLSGVALHWPRPEFFSNNGMWYLGFEDELILPIELIPSKTGDMTLSGTMSLGVCDEICIPLEAELRAELPEQLRGSHVAAIQSALKNQPTRVENARCDATPISDGMRLTARLTVPDLGGEEVAVIEHPDQKIWVSEAMLRRQGRQVHVESDLVPAEAQPFSVNRADLTITVIGGGKAYEARGCRAN